MPEPSALPPPSPMGASEPWTVPLPWLGFLLYVAAGYLFAKLCPHLSSRGWWGGELESPGRVGCPCLGPWSTCGILTIHLVTAARPHLSREFCSPASLPGSEQGPTPFSALLLTPGRTLGHLRRVKMLMRVFSSSGILI